MKTAIIYGVIAALIAWFFMYLDTRILDNQKQKITYIKNMLLIGSIVGFGIYLIGEDTFEKAVGVQSGTNNIMMNNNTDADMLTGNPNF
jgi:H+/Cl- antiporter ClcA